MKNMRFLLIPILIIPAFMTMLLSLAAVTQAATITVNSTQDTDDPFPADGNCDVDGGMPGNQCTLRAAIQTAQAVAGSDRIDFAGSLDITLNSTLPALSETGLTIQAETGQTVRISGQNIVQNIFYITGSYITISNVVIYGSGEGWSNIWIDEAEEGVVIANNLIGDDDPAAGSCSQINSSYGGIYINGNNNSPTTTHRVWIYGNTIECHGGLPGEGISLDETDLVFIGQHLSEAEPAVPGNIIRHNHYRYRLYLLHNYRF